MAMRLQGWASKTYKPNWAVCAVPLAIPSGFGLDFSERTQDIWAQWDKYFGWARQGSTATEVPPEGQAWWGKVPQGTEEKGSYLLFQARETMAHSLPQSGSS